MEPLARRKFIGVAALSGAGLAALKPHEIEEHAMADENLMAEQIKKEKIRRAMLAGPSSVTADATVAEMDHQGSLTVLRPGTIGFVFQATRTLLGGRIWLLIRWAWFGSKIFLRESRNRQTRPLA